MELEEFSTNRNEQQFEQARHAAPASTSQSNGAFDLRAKLQQLRGGNMLIVAVFAASLIGLYIYSISRGPKEASAKEQLVEAQVDNAILTLKALSQTSPKSNSATRMVEAFYYEAKQRQVPLEKLNGNPFIFIPPEPVEPAEPEVKEFDKTPEPNAQEKELADAMAEVKKLKLQSVMVGSSSAIAMISNNLLSVGQEISGWTVTSIAPRKVVLSWKDQKYVLELQN